MNRIALQPNRFERPAGRITRFGGQPALVTRRTDRDGQVRDCRIRQPPTGRKAVRALCSLSDSASHTRQCPGKSAPGIAPAIALPFFVLPTPFTRARVKLGYTRSRGHVRHTTGGRSWFASFVSRVGAFRFCSSGDCFSGGVLVPPQPIRRRPRTSNKSPLFGVMGWLPLPGPTQRTAISGALLFGAARPRVHQ